MAHERESTAGHVLHFAAAYDVLAWVFTRGRPRSYQNRLLDLAHVASGETVLDVGCGTGSLAVAAGGRVGSSGAVCGIDASPKMIERAQRKAQKAGVNVRFQEGVVEHLPFEPGTFDLVLSTLMLHHLPRPARAAMAGEVARVLKPGGRVLIVDFATPSSAKRTFISHLHRHGYTKVEDNLALLGAAGLRPVESGTVGFADLHFVLATQPLSAAR
jgi:ubiquinone/menaquinone biosynthesis C-methylase UbiE